MRLDEQRGASQPNGETLAERWWRLDDETLVEASAAVARGRRFRCLDVARAPLVFMRALFSAGALRRGTPGLIEAGMRAIHTFVCAVRIWSLQHDAERGGEPHEDRPR
ncbi:MAG: hypothetical protein JW889_14875 [Verrucomicrobia bacterium]|nr:hypothetical protein [Verrucomicrobiota bacterium]